ncbi:50S ribosomal protein L20 [Anaerolineae bacterium]|nr:50S ribosomal protein L20 [Anaerolineaceae bacterium]GDX68161.1 50S ribosomal protein L20 [Anaerolineae bacterium]
MTRVKTGPYRRQHHKKVLKRTEGHFGARHKVWRRANESMMHALWYAYRDRRNRRRDLRRLWIVRINAGARINGISYSRLVAALGKANIHLNRKTLADLAVRDPHAFSEVVRAARAA